MLVTDQWILLQLVLYIVLVKIFDYFDSLLYDFCTYNARDSTEETR